MIASILLSFTFMLSVYNYVNIEDNTKEIDNLDKRCICEIVKQCEETRKVDE